MSGNDELHPILDELRSLEQENAELKRLLKWSFERNMGWHLLPLDAPERAAIEKIVGEV